MKQRTFRAPAKVNLFLRVLAREASGFHSLETIFLAVDLHDRVTVRARTEPGVELVVEGDEELGPPDRNLAVRAARAFREGGSASGEGGVEILLQKRIPAGAGLGGGSSDAAAVLRALQRVEGGVGDRTLLRIGRSLGSDVPYFLSTEPLALAWGRGDRLLALPPLPSRPVVIAVPSAPIATAEAYGELRRRREEASARSRENIDEARLLALDELRSWEGIYALAENDFEPVAFDLVPDCRMLRDALVRAGAPVALLSGSGSAVFGVFEDGEEASAAADEIEGALPGVRIHRGSTLARWPSP